MTNANQSVKNKTITRLPKHHGALNCATENRKTSAE